MKSRYFIIAALISAVFAVFFYYYHVWIASSRKWVSPPHSDLLYQMATVAVVVALVCLGLALVVAVMRAVDGRNH